MANVISGVTSQSPHAEQQDVLVDDGGRIIHAAGAAALPGYTRLQDSDSEDAAEVSAVGASIAATILGLVTRSVGYLWDSVSGTWIRATCNAAGEAILAGYTAATQSLRMGEIDPLDQRYEPGRVSVTNGADATHYYYFDLAGFKQANFQLALDCTAGTVVATVEGSMQDDGSAPASCTYADVTLDTFGVASLVSAAAPASDEWVDDANVLGGFKYVRVKIVAATGATTGDWTITTKRLW